MELIKREEKRNENNTKFKKKKGEDWKKKLLTFLIWERRRNLGEGSEEFLVFLLS